MTAPSDRISAALAGRYRIERELGQGGMATVYLAEDLKHHRMVAIKVLRPELAAALGAERFLREIDLTASLDHPHILPLYDSGQSAGSPETLFYVMPFVEGESLRDKLKREKQLPVDDALRITREVADALGYAHERGIIHRDVKPENILLSGRHARVADFGIARAIDMAGGASLTGTGMSLGTPSYMSPEQAAAEEELDGRSDIYALACVLYELLAGQPPFTGPTAERLVYQHMAVEPVPVTQLRPSVPAHVAMALQRGLAKAPADRFGSVREFADALGAESSGQSRPAAELKAPGRSARARVIAGVAIPLMLLLLSVLYLALRRPVPATALHLGALLQVTRDAGLELDPALSPDGKFVAYSGPEGALMVRQVEGGDPIQVVRGGDVRGRWPAWGPDGQWLLFVSPRGIERVPALGGAPRFLSAAIPPERGVALAPDGRSYAFVSHDSLYAAPVDGGPTRLITAGREMHSPVWSPGGRWIAFVSGNVQFIKTIDLGNMAPSSIQVVPAAGGSAVPISDNRSVNVSPAWGPGDLLLWVSDRGGGRDIYQVRLTPAGGAAGPPVRLTTGLNPHGIAVAAGGSRLAYSAFTETSNVWSLPIPASGSVSIAAARPVTAGTQVAENIDVSEDARWLSFSADRTGTYQLYRVHFDQPGAELHQVTADTSGSWWPAWSPDGAELAYHKFQGERRAVFVIPADGGAPVRVTDGSQDERTPEWSPDGKQLLLLANWATHPQLHLVTRTAGGTWSAPRTIPVVIGGDTVASGISAWSPDGRLLACGCGAGGLAIVPVDGGPARRLPSPFSSVGWAFPQWSADGRTVYHLTEDSGRVVSVVAVPLSGERPHVVVRFDDPTRPWHRFGFRVRRGQIYVTLGDRQSDIWVARLDRS